MPRKGIDLSTCPSARVRPAVCTPRELAFATTLSQALKKKVLILLKVRVLDVIELIDDPADRRRMFFWRDFLGDIHFDYVVCSKQSITPLLAVELDHDEPLHRGCATRDVAKTTLARRAAFPLVRINATDAYTPETLRETLIAAYKRTKAGPLPAEMGD